MSTLEIIIVVIGALAALVTIPLIVSKIAGKIADIAEKAAVGGDVLADLLESYGFEKAALAIKEGADIPDELGDLAKMLEQFTADQKLTADEVRKLFEAGQEVWVEMKDFRVKVFPKKQ